MDVLIGKVARELAALEEQMDRVFERSFGAGVQLPRRGDSFRPAVDVYDAGDCTVVRVDLAGVVAKDVRLVVDGEYLQVSGRRTVSHALPADQHLQMEIPQGNFARVLHMRAPFEADRVTATLEMGILTVELPRVRPTTRDIPVRSV